MIQPREVPDINNECEILVDINTPRDRMRCPACGAHRSGRLFCHRCKSDLTILVEAETQADMLYERALQAYTQGRFREAHRLAAASSKIILDRDTLRLQACAALRTGDFQGAYDAGLAALEDEEE